MKDSLIFLDFDGVLNIIEGSNPTYLKQSNHFEKDLVENLNYILEHSNVNIVMSSSWRSDFDDAIYQLQLSGFKYPERFIDLTLELNHRGLEISQWLKNHNFKGKYLCIDDNISEISEIIPSENILCISPLFGLNKEKVFKVLSFFIKKAVRPHPLGRS